MFREPHVTDRLVREDEKGGYFPTGNMRCKVHVLGKFVFSGDVFGDPRLSILVDPYNRRYFQHTHFIPIVGVGKSEAYINWSMMTCQGSNRSELP